MEFSYKLTESEYLLAHKIAPGQPLHRRRRILSNGLGLVQIIVTWGAFVAGMVLERSEMVGIVSDGAKANHYVWNLVLSSFFPGFAFAWLAYVMLHILSKSFNQSIRRRNFEDNPGCQVETTVEANSERISFRSATGSSASVWRCYAGWEERGGIAVLVTKGGVRQILKTADLPELERKEFYGLLATAIPKN